MAQQQSTLESLVNANQPLDATQLVKDDLEYICLRLDRELSTLSGKRVALTGGAGFLGYYLVQSIVHWNHTRGREAPIHLTVYDNYQRGEPRWLRQLVLSHDVKVVTHDITQPFPDSDIAYHYLLHAASIASPTYYRQHPLETMDANVNGLRHLLNYCRHQRETSTPVEGFLFFSSSEIYGDPPATEIPTSETYPGQVSCTGPRACYDESKRYGETLCVTFAQHYDLPIKIVRPFNNYGPGLKLSDRRVLPDFARDILANRDIVLLSDGSPTRTFCYIADAVMGYIKALIWGTSGEAYNIGTEAPEISIASLAAKMATLGRDHLPYTGQVVRQVSPDANYLIDNPQRRCPAIAKAISHLGYAPEVDLATGLTRSLMWYAHHPDGA